MPDELHCKHGWFAGFFDADGTITLSLKGVNRNPQLTISATNKLLIDVSYFKEIFGGNIYFDKSQNGYYKWSIQNRENILFFSKLY
jgi:intein/homing endonuclease